MVTPVLLGIVVFGFWSMLKPHWVIERELLQMFRWTGDYFVGRMMMPGGLARYVADFLSQFFISVRLGAFLLALMAVLSQGLSWIVLRRMRPQRASSSSAFTARTYALSFVPALVFNFLLCDMRVQLTLFVAFLMTLACLALLPRRRPSASLAVSAVVVVIGYWLIGPMVLLVPLYHLRWLTVRQQQLKTVVSAIALTLLLTVCMFCSLRVTPYPLRIVAQGIDYVWSTGKIGTDEEMQYDLLLREADWKSILQKASQQPPHSAASRHIVQLAAWYQGQISQQQLAETFSNVRESINSSVAAGMMSDFCMHLGVLNIAQRAAFELNESAVNYNKSARAMKRLAETALCTGQYEVALKYVALLEQTLFYRSWAHDLRDLAEHPDRLKAHKKYGMYQKVYAEATDHIFI